MERFIQAVGESVDRRSFMRWLGKVGVGAAMAAGGLLLPAKELFAQHPSLCTNLCANLSGYCVGEAVGAACTLGGGHVGVCRQTASCSCGCASH